MNTSRMVVVRGSAVSVCLVLSACSSGTKSAVEKADPLTEFYGQQSPEKIAAMQAKAQKKTAECMRTQGFTYVPYSPPQSQMFTGPKPGQELEWKRKNGYGMSVGIETYGVQNAQIAADPNQAIENKLSPSDRQAYRNALYGAASKPGEGVDVVPSGCLIAGYYGGNNKEIQALQMALQLKYGSLGSRIQADPRIVAQLRNGRVACVKRASKGLMRRVTFTKIS